MDKETLNEYGTTIITAIIAALLLLVLTGSTFLGAIKDAMDAVIPEHEYVEYANNEVFRALAEGESGIMEQGGTQ